MDQFYTPQPLAALLTASARTARPKLVADFAMGDGALLKAAASRWPRAKLFGSDIDPAAAHAAQGFTGRLKVCVNDFLEGSETPQLAELRGSCDVVLLNPPFTCKGSKRFKVTLDGEEYTGSKALVFVARAVGFLRPKGELVAILPASCLTSQRDASLLKVLRTRCAVEPMGEIRRNAFAGCSVSVILVRVKRLRAMRPDARADLAPRFVAMKPYRVVMMRGCTPIHRTSISPARYPVLHTTDLGREVDFPGRWSNEAKRIVEGLVVLLPRVGRPDPSKIVLRELEETCLSDCVIAMRSDPVGLEADIFRLMRANWHRFEDAYGGSCAPYLTLEALRLALRSVGLDSEVADDMHLTQRTEASTRMYA